MPYQFTFDRTPGGYSVNAARLGEQVHITSTEFTSSEDGRDFVTKLEGLPDEILRKLPLGQRVLPSQVDHLLAIIRRDKTATVYVNELPFILNVRASRPVDAGQPVHKDDIADIKTLDLGAITIPEDAGVVLVWSVGWRKGFFYDLAPLFPDRCPRRAFDVRSTFGQLYGYLLFQERFSINEIDWEKLFSSKWFPFIGLPNNMIQEMLDHVRAGWSVDELTKQIVGAVKENVPVFLQAWDKHPTFAEHSQILHKAAERFRADDFISCTSLIFQRIEGLLRSNHAAVGCTDRPSQKNLAASAVQSNLDRERCLLLPHRFQQYLDQVYFADFDPSDPNIGVSRNSVGHGVASADQFDEKAAAVGLLVAHQLFYCFGQPNS